MHVAAWCVARMLRSLGRIEEALARQMALKEESEFAGESDGYIFEEIGECLLTLNRLEEARAYFAKAYELFSKYSWLMEHETERLARLKHFGM